MKSQVSFVKSKQLARVRRCAYFALLAANVVYVLPFLLMARVFYQAGILEVGAISFELPPTRSP